MSTRAVRPLAVLFALWMPIATDAETGADVEANRMRVAVRLDALEANQAVLLGAPSITGPLNDIARRYGMHRTGPLRRDYSIKMVWAAARRTALYLGANHAVPHRLNDVWEFDLGDLTWRLLYAPDHPRSFGGLGDDPSDVEFRDGVLITRRGGPAIIGHTWWGIAYHPGRSLLYYMNVWKVDDDKLVRQVGGDPSQRYRGPALWTFDPAQGRWAFEKTPQPWPPANEASALEYVPSLDGLVWQTNHRNQAGAWLFRPERGRWVYLNVNLSTREFREQAPAREQVMYVDPVRNMIVGHSGKSTHHFDVAALRWTRVLDADKESDQVPAGHDARTVFHYDPVSGHGLLCELVTGRLWSYDPDAVTWRKLEPAGDALPAGRRGLAYLDVARNVFVIILDGAVWAYRYATAAGGSKR